MKKFNIFGKLAGILAAVLAAGSMYSPSVLAAQDEPLFPEDMGVYSEAEVCGEADYSIAASDKKDWIVGYWHFKDGVLTYDTDSSGALDIRDYIEEHGNEIRKVVVKSGPHTMKSDPVNDKDKTVNKLFQGLESLEEVVYEEPVTIKDMCFIFEGMYKDCINLRKVTIGAAAKNHGLEINKEAFYNCPNLSEVSFGKGLWHFGRRTFYGCTSLKKITFPADIANIRGDSFGGCSALKELELSSSNQWMRVVNNCVIEYNDPHKDERKDAFITPCLMMVPEGLVSANGGNYNVVKGVKDIQWGAFQSDLSLENVVLSTTVQSIQSEAFIGCTNLKTVTLPKKLKRVGQYAFSPDDKENFIGGLTDIYYEGSEEEWKKVKLAEYSIDKGYINKISITGTTTLYDNLEKAGIPANVKVHFNQTIKDTDYSVESGETETVSVNASMIPELAALGVNINLFYTTQVEFCGRKHVRSTAKYSDSTRNDVAVDAMIIDSATGLENDNFTISKVQFKNSRNAGTPESVKAPYLTIQIKAKSAKKLTPDQKKSLKVVNKKLKTVENCRFKFTITPIDVSVFTKKDNTRGMTINGDMARFKIVAYEYKYKDKAGSHSDWLVLKPCKNNDDSAKGDYTTKAEGNKVTLYGHGNYTGSVEFTKE